MVSSAQVGTSVRRLLLVALGVFLVTVAIGMVNGLDLYAFSHDQLLTHVHSGTLGWITLALVAATMWVNRRAEPRLALALIVLIPVYVAAFYTGNIPFRAVSGVALLLAIAWFLVWVWQVSDRRSLPSLAIALGMTSFALGALVGVLLQVVMATGTSLFPSGADVIGAHAATMVFSYLILVVMGVLEAQVLGTRGLPTLGLIQVGALFAGGLVLMVTFLFAASSAQAILPVYLLLQLVATILFAIRVLPRAVATDWTSTGPARQLAAAAVFVIVAMGLLVYLIVLFMSAADPSDPNALPLGVLVASDHAAFIGVVSNLVFGVIAIVAGVRAARIPWLGQLGFWAMNLGLAVFLVGLAGESADLKRIGAPIMGTGILILMALATMAIWTPDSVHEPAAEM